MGGNNLSLFSCKETIVVHSLPPLKLGVDHLSRALTPSLQLRPCRRKQGKSRPGKKKAELHEIGLQPLIVAYIFSSLQMTNQHWET